MSNRTIVTKGTRLKVRQKIIDSMSKPLQKVYTKLRDDNVDLIKTSLHYYRSIGEQIQLVTADVNKYGAGAIKQLAVALDASPDLLYKSAAFFREYSEEEFAALLELRTATGSGLTWTHVIQLLPVMDHKQRTRLQEMAARNNWTSDELRQAVTEHMAKIRPPRKEGAGRPPVKPKNPLEGLRSFIVGVDEFSKKGETFWFEIFDTMAEVPPDSITPVMVEQAERAVVAATKASEVVQRELDTMMKLRDRYKEVVAARTEEGDAAATDDDEDEDEDGDDEE